MYPISNSVGLFGLCCCYRHYNVIVFRLMAVLAVIIVMLQICDDDGITLIMALQERLKKGGNQKRAIDVIEVITLSLEL